MRKDEYIASAVSKITNRKAKRETEKELAEHIDELIEHYTKNGWIGIDAELRAVADMGEPEAVCQELGKLHRGAGKRVYVALLILMMFFCVAEQFGLAGVCSYVEALHLHRLLYYGNAHLEFEFFYTDLIIPYIILILLTVIGYRKHKPFLDIVFSIILFSTAKSFIFFFSEEGLYWFPLSLASILPPLTLLILVFVLLLLLYREEKTLNGYKPKNCLLKRLLTVLAVITVLTFISVCYNDLLELVSELRNASSYI